MSIAIGIRSDKGLLTFDTLFRGTALLSMIRSMASNGELAIGTLPDFASIQTPEEVESLKRDVAVIRLAAKQKRVAGEIDANGSFLEILNDVDFDAGQKITVA